MLWLVKIWQVSSCGKFMHHLETCLLWQLKLTEFCVNFRVNLWCFLMSFSTGCTKCNTAAIKSLLLFLAGWFIGFLVEKCSILKLVYFDSWSWQSFLSSCDVFYCLPTGCTKWNTAAINSLLLFMAGLFTEFLVEKCAACQSQKSDFGWHRFHFSSCWMRVEKSLKRLSGAASRMVSLSNYCVCFFISNFMKSSAVYEASLGTFVLRSETMIWPSMRFDISLQNFKKPLVNIFSPQIERKNVPKSI